MKPELVLSLRWRSFAFGLVQPLKTAGAHLQRQRGWLVQLQAPDGASGWGDITPPPASWQQCQQILHQLSGDPIHRAAQLEGLLPQLPKPIAFGLGLALAELAGLGNWQQAPASAWLLPAGPAAIAAMELALRQPQSADAISVKWKVGSFSNQIELTLLDKLLELLPTTGRLRLDANGGWDRPTADSWVERLRHEPRLEWLEQPLAPQDHEGLTHLAKKLPIALDESLRDAAGVPPNWRGWRVHKPALEGDPRPLLQALKDGTPNLMVSTAFGTGISNRLLAHLAALQFAGPTPCAPGLAPGWGPLAELASFDPQTVWDSAQASIVNSEP